MSRTFSMVVLAQFSRCSPRQPRDADKSRPRSGGPKERATPKERPAPKVRPATKKPLPPPRPAATLRRRSGHRTGPGHADRHGVYRHALDQRARIPGDYHSQSSVTDSKFRSTQSLNDAASQRTRRDEEPQRHHLAVALNLMLRDLNLTWTIKDEVLLITTPEEAENHLTTKVSMWPTWWFAATARANCGTIMIR